MAEILINNDAYVIQQRFRNFFVLISFFSIEILVATDINSGVLHLHLVVYNCAVLAYDSMITLGHEIKQQSSYWQLKEFRMYQFSRISRLHEEKLRHKHDKCWVSLFQSQHIPSVAD